MILAWDFYDLHILKKTYFFIFNVFEIIILWHIFLSIKLLI
jgi:hypothetical protein